MTSITEMQAEIERLRGLLSREQKARHAALAEVDRITEAGRVHIRRAAAFEAQRDELLAALRLSRGNVASLGPAMAIEPHTPYRPWLAELDRVIALAEGGAA